MIRSLLGLGLAITLCIDASAAPRVAAKSRGAGARRTIPGLIALATASARQYSFPVVLGQHLGFNRDMFAWGLHYSDAQAENGYQKSLYVIRSDDANPTPTELVWMATRTDARPDGNHYDVRAFRTDLGGNWKAGVHATGPGKAVTYSAIAADRASRAALKKDIDYFQIKAARYEPAK